MIKQANYLGIVVKDIEAATAYYRDTLGLAVNKEQSIPGQYTQFALEGGAILSLQAKTDIPGGQPFEPALVVDDADATYAAWQAKGVELLEAPHDLLFGRTFLFRTPQGQTLRAYRPNF